MIRDEMMDEIQELKLSGYSFREVLEELGRRHTKAPCGKTLRKHHNTGAALQDSRSRPRKEHALDAGPFRSEIPHILAENPGCYMSSACDVLVEKYVEGGMYEMLPGNEQTLRNYIRHLRGTGRAGQEEDRRRRYDVVETPPPGRKAQTDFGQVDCGSGLVVHFICILLWHSRLLGVYARDRRYGSEEACRAIHRLARISPSPSCIASW